MCMQMRVTASVDDAVAVVEKLEELSLRTEVDSKDAPQMAWNYSFTTPLKTRVRFVQL